MTMLDRNGHALTEDGAAAREKQPRRSRRPWRRKERAETAPPPSAGPDEETVRIERPEFRKARRAPHWRRARRLLAILLVVALVAGAVWVVFFSSLVTARSVAVTGTRSLTEARIER